MRAALLHCQPGGPCLVVVGTLFLGRLQCYGLGEGMRALVVRIGAILYHEEGSPVAAVEFAWLAIARLRTVS